MTDFGRRVGDMKKSVYDTDGDGVADNAETLEGQTLSQVQDHTPKAHTHTEAQITNLDHNAAKIVGVPVDATDKGNAKVLAYNATSENLEYETPTGGGDTFVDRGDPADWDWQVGNLTTDGAWHDLDCSGVVPIGATTIFFRCIIRDSATAGIFSIRKNGNSETKNAVALSTQEANIDRYGSLISFCDAGRVVEYLGSNRTFDRIDVCISGWLI